MFGALLVCTPLAVIVAIVIMILSGYETKLSSLWFLAFPITTLMLFLFYFTRVGLQHVRSVQSQMMQLELRMALCQFIHNYADDSEKLHKKNSAGFEKFENIIFSPLVHPMIKFQLHLMAWNNLQNLSVSLERISFEL